IQKYCDKALGKSTKGPSISNRPDIDCSFGIGEMESMRGPDPLSSGANSSPSFSLSGNPVAPESGSSFSDKPSLPLSGNLGKDHDSFVLKASETVALSPRNNSTSSLPFSSGQSAVTSSSQSTAATVSAANIGGGGKGHRSLSRKGSSRSPAIPQPIEEVSTAAEEGLATAEGEVGQKDTDIREFIYRRYGPKGTDPYDTQPTFGDKKGYESMPQGILHDQEQFFSFGNRAVGVPGIGEVVFGNQRQLRLVAGFWEKKREDCERTHTVPPYQHREEGVILSQYKGLFSILRTRYQKHDQWERVAHLGNGMSGKCHLAKDLMTEFKFCCKKVHLLKYSKEEVNLWSELNHPYIVKLYGVLRHGVKVYIFCEFIDGGSLATCIQEQRHLGQRFSHWAAINYFHQLLKVLSYLQSIHVLHEDIKADNILVRSGCTRIALTDFGTCRRLCDPKELLNKSPVGSPAHWSPEKAASQGHGFPSDLWAAVCVLIHMLSGDPPWMRRFMKSATILNFIIYSREPPLEDVPPNVQPMVRDLIASGLVKDAEKRPRADTLLGHGAFRILENTQPERYYSSLGGVSQAAFLAKAIDTEKGSQILYSAEISAGPYQESAGPTTEAGENRCNDEEVVTKNERSGDDQQEMEEPSEIMPEDNRRAEEETSDSQPENVPKRLNEASTRLLDQNSDAFSAVAQLKEKNISSGKPQQIPDLNALISSLFVPDESKAFYTDDVLDGVEALKQSTFKQQKLEVFIPESSKQNELPNLSIFGMDLYNGSGQDGSLTQKSFLEVATETHYRPSQHIASPGGVESLWSALTSSKHVENVNNTSFNLSSESEDYTSADLFDQGSIAGPETIKNSSTAFEIQTPLNSSNTLLFQSNEKSPYIDYANPLNQPSLSTNLQQRKPYHLRLNLSPTSSGSTLTPLAAGSSLNSNEGGTGATPNKASLRGTLSSHRTPSTGRLSAASSSSRLGGSSTSGSRTSPLPFRFNMPGSSSVLEEQEKRMQILKAEQESLSSSGSEFFNDDQVPAQEDNAPDKTEDGDWQLYLSRIQENIDPSSLEGHGLQIFDEKSMEVVLPVHFMETPVNKRQLVESISGRLSMRYGHFSLLHMDKSPLELSTPLKAHRLLVRQLPGPQKGCLCDSCRSQF
ncbi:mitogen-activated protein kinase kinase kinase 2, partial [Elysia marginata]